MHYCFSCQNADCCQYLCTIFMVFKFDSKYRVLLDSSSYPDTLNEIVTIQTSCQLFDSHILSHQIDM